MKRIRFFTTLFSLVLVFALVFNSVAKVSRKEFLFQAKTVDPFETIGPEFKLPKPSGRETVGPILPQEELYDAATRNFLNSLGEKGVRREIAEIILKTVDREGVHIVGVGSWIKGKKFVEGTSDFDMRLVMTEASEAEAVATWKSVRQSLIEQVTAKYGDRAPEILSKMNVYPPEVVLDGIDDADEAIAKLTNDVKVNPNLGGEKVEGLFGKGPKAFRDTYEASNGRAFWKSGSSVKSGFADLLPLGETRGIHTIWGGANTSSQIADKVDDALKKYDAKTVKKNLNRLKDELAKTRNLAGLEKNTYLDDLLKKINAFEDTPEGLEALRKELINPTTRRAIDNVIGRAKMDSQLLKTFAESSHPRDLKILKEMLEEGTGKWARVKNALSEASSYVPWSGLLKAFMAFMVVIQVKQVTSDWKAGDYEKAFQSILTDAGFLVSFPVGMLAMIVSSIIEDAKDAGYALVTRYQDCEDLLAGIYEVKGREQISDDQKAETNVAQLATKYADKDDVIKIVAEHAHLAASRGEGGKETKKVDAEVEKKLIERCTPEIIGKWNNKRAELIGDAVEILNTIQTQIEAIGVSGNVTPDPSVLRIGKADVEASASFDRSGADESKLIDKYITALRDLGGDKHVVAVSVKHSYRWLADNRQFSIDEEDFSSSRPIFNRDLTSRKLSFGDANPHTAQLEYILSIDVMTSADDVQAAKGYLVRAFSKKVPFQITVIDNETPTPTPTASPGPSGKIELIVSPAEVKATEKFNVRAKLPPELAAAAKSFNWYSSADLINWEGDRWHTTGSEAVMRFGPGVGRSSDKAAFDPNQRISLNVLDAQKHEIGRAEITIKLKSIAIQASAMNSWDWSADSAGIHLKRKSASKKARCGDKDCTATVQANIDITWCESCPANAEELKKAVGSMHGGFLRTQNYRVTPGKEESITIAGYSGSFANKTPQYYVEGNPEGLVDLAFPAVTSFVGGVAMKDGIAICFRGTAWGGGTRLGESGSFWFDDSPFVNQQGKAAYSEMMAILTSVTLGPDANVKQLPYKGPALDGSDLPSLKLVLSPNNKKLRKGDVVNVQVVIEHDENVEKPLRFEWTGDHAGNGPNVQFLATKPGKQTLAVNVTDVGSAAVEFEVEDLQAKIIQVSPTGPKIMVGTPATFSAQLLSGGQPLSGNYVYRWQPTPDVKFDPAEGPANQAKAIFSRPGRQRVFVQILEKKGEVLQTLAESEQIEVEIVKPDFKITFEPQSVQVGKEVKAVIQLQPVDLKDIDFRWELTTNGKLIRESQDKREITFIPLDTEPVTVAARARVPFPGDDLGSQTATITAQKIDVKVNVLGAEGPKPQIWKEGVGLVPLETGIAVNQFVGFRADVTPAQEDLRYEWSLNEDSHFAGNNLGQQIRVSRSQTGTGEATVIVRDKNGLELGRGTGTFSVTVSQADLDITKTRAGAAAKLAQAKELIPKGKLDGAIALADEASGLDPKNAEAATLSNKWKVERTTIETQLSKARSLMSQQKFKDAAREMAVAKNLHGQYKPVLDAEKELADAAAKYESGSGEGIRQVKLGDDLYENSNYQAAIAAYNKALAADPNSAAAYAGRCLAKRGSSDTGAPQDCEKALQLDPNNADAYRGRSMIKRGNNDLQGALADADRSIALAPENYRSYLTRGLTKDALKDLSGALADYNRSIQLNSNYAMSYYYRGTVKLNLKDNSGALADLDRFVSLSPKNSIGYNNRGLAYERLGDTKHAIADYETVIALDPKNEIAKTNLANLRAKLAGEDRLGREWSETENAFIGRWVRRGNSKIWDASWNNGAVAELSISIAGDKVTISRRDVAGPSIGLTGIYEGTLALDGTMHGTETVTFAGNLTNSRFDWQARIVAPVNVPPPPVKPPTGSDSRNLALNRPAKQSSISSWSHPNGSQGGVDGVIGADYGFHTEIQANPWWQVDLGAVKSLSEIRIFNRHDCCLERARTIQVLLSNDGVTWNRAFSNPGTIFGADGSPLIVSVKGLSARFVRLQLAETNYLHLDEVEVYGTDSPGTVVTPTDTTHPPTPADATPKGTPVEIFNGMNTGGVSNGPTVPTVVTFSKPFMITSVMNYHWNNGRGTQRPGTISLRGSDGAVYGPWAAKGINIGTNTPNGFWEVQPNVMIPAGTYTIVDSDPSTWAQNGQSGGRGFSTVKGYLTDGAPVSPSTPPPPSTPGRMTISLTYVNGSAQYVHIFATGETFAPINRLSPGGRRVASGEGPIFTKVTVYAGVNGQVLDSLTFNVVPNGKYTVTFGNNNRLSVK